MVRSPVLRYPNDDYLLALGEAVVNFGIVELSVVAFVDHRKPGFHATSYDLTAGQIMNELIDAVKGDDKLTQFALYCQNLAIIRNTLLHARPVNEEVGEAAFLRYAGKEGFHEFQMSDIEQFSELCMPVIMFFNDWAEYMIDRGHDLLNYDAFIAKMEPLLKKWDEAAKKKQAKLAIKTGG